MTLHNDLSLILENLWGGTITTFHFDYFHHELTIGLHVLENGLGSEHQVKIKGVCGLMWVNDSGSSRYTLEGPPYSELTTITYNDHIKEVVQIDGEWCSNYLLTPNLVLEIWNQILLVEASQIEINGQIWSLKYLEEI